MCYQELDRIKHLDPEREKELFQNIKIKKPRRNLPVDQLISRMDITRLVDACEKPRDRALIMLMWDSGARISELLDLNIGHVQFDKYGAVIIVTGKTGMRRLRLISSVPDIHLGEHSPAPERHQGITFHYLTVLRGNTPTPEPPNRGKPP